MAAELEQLSEELAKQGFQTGGQLLRGFARALHEGGLIPDTLASDQPAAAEFAPRHEQLAPSPLPDLRELGSLLERRRKERGLSRAELARRLGLSETYIYHVERAVSRAHGEPSQPSRTVLERWGHLLEWSPAEIVHALALANQRSEQT